MQLYRRSHRGGWDCADYTGLTDSLTLESIGCTLRLAEIYDKVESLPPPATDTRS